MGPTDNRSTVFTPWGSEHSYTVSLGFREMQFRELSRSPAAGDKVAGSCPRTLSITPRVLWWQSQRKLTGPTDRAWFTRHKETDVRRVWERS